MELLTKPFPNSRTRTLFVLEDDTGPRLYASTNGGRIYRYDGKDSFAELKAPFFPGIPGLKEVFAARPTVFRKQVVYIAARQIIDHDWAPLGLLAAGGASVGIRPMVATAYAANAVSVSVPLAGPAMATAFTFRRFTRQGADAPLAGWALLYGLIDPRIRYG